MGPELCISNTLPGGMGAPARQTALRVARLKPTEAVQIEAAGKTKTSWWTWNEWLKHSFMISCGFYFSIMICPPLQQRKLTALRHFELNLVKFKLSLGHHSWGGFIRFLLISTDFSLWLSWGYLPGLVVDQMHNPFLRMRPMYHGKGQRWLAAIAAEGQGGIRLHARSRLGPGHNSQWLIQMACALCARR